MSSTRSDPRSSPFLVAATCVAVLLTIARVASAQTPPATPSTVPPPQAPAQGCEVGELAFLSTLNVDPATRLPPKESPPLYRCAELQFHPVNESFVDGETYTHYIKAKPSQRSQQNWVPYDEKAVLADFDSLWRLGYLDNLWIEVVDDPYANGVAAKRVIYHL